jgi:hypothetical protein
VRARQRAVLMRNLTRHTQTSQKLTFVIKEAVLGKHEPAALPQHQPLATLLEEPPLQGDFGRGRPLDHRRAQLRLAAAAAVPAPSPPVLQHTTTLAVEYDALSLTPKRDTERI